MILDDPRGDLNNAQRKKKILYARLTCKRTLFKRKSYRMRHSQQASRFSVRKAL